MSAGFWIGSCNLIFLNEDRTTKMITAFSSHDLTSQTRFKCRLGGGGSREEDGMKFYSCISPVKSIYTKPTAQLLQHVIGIKISSL